MTTIRVIRQPRISEAGVEGTGTPPSAGPAENPEESVVRLALIDPPAAGTTLDGAWWPRTRTLSAELPPLVEELRRRGLKVTRVAYNPAPWEPTARRLEADGRTIRLGWFRSIDRQLFNLTGDEARGRLDLLVVPPDLPAAVAQRAFSAATDPANRDTPTALLEALNGPGTHVPHPRPAAAQPDSEELAVWDSEGGHLVR